MPTVLLAGSPILDVDATIFIYLGVFFLLFFLLRALVFRPAMAVFDEREVAIDGAKAEARDLERAAEEKLAAFESEMAKVRAEALTERDRLRAEGTQLERTLTEKVRRETEELVADCEGSLERLGREQIDLWLLHNPGDEVLRRDGWREAVERLEEDGKIRAWGASVGDAEEARLAIDAGAQALCLTHNLLSPGTLDELRDDVAAAGCGVLARSPLMYGMLAGHWNADRRFSNRDHRAQRWNTTAFSERIRQVDELRFLVGDRHPDLATAALRFVLTHSAVTTAIVGARAPYQIAAAVEAADGPPYLADDEVIRLAKLRDATRY